MNHLPETLRQVFSERQVYIPSGERTALHSNVSEEECTRLYDVVRGIRPTVSAEIGLAQGISTLAILKALHDGGQGVHHVIDPFQSQFDNCGLAMVKRAALENRFVFYEKFAEEVVPSLPRLQFAFIDASHLFDLTLCEFVLIDKRLEIGGIVGLHDLWMPSLQKLVRFILQNRSYAVEGATSVRRRQGSPLAMGVRAIARRLPGHERIFAREFLTPWEELGLPDLVFLRKTAEDARDWRQHNAF